MKRLKQFTNILFTTMMMMMMMEEKLCENGNDIFDLRGLAVE